MPAEIQQAIARLLTEEKGLGKEKLYKAAANIRDARLSYNALREAIDDPHVTAFLITQLAHKYINNKFSRPDLIEAVVALHTRAAAEWLHEEMIKSVFMQASVTIAIINALFKGHDDVAQFLLSLAYSKKDNKYLLRADAANGDFQTLLMAAAFDGNTELLKKVLAMGADVSLVDKHDQTALGYAIGNGNKENIDLLLAAGAPLLWNNEEDDLVGTALYAAAQANNLALVEKFLPYPEMRAHVNIISENVLYTAIDLAAYNNNYLIFTRLLEVPGVRINAGTLDLALRHNKQMAQDILNKDVDPNDSEPSGRYPIFGVFQQDADDKPLNDDEKSLELTKLMIAHGANVQVANDSGQTPLMLAIWQAKAKTVKELLKYEPKESIEKVDGQGHSALWYAHNLQTHNKDLIIKILEEAKAKAQGGK